MASKKNWYLDPTYTLDVYQVDKSNKRKTITFHTDIDVLKIKLKPGEKFDFIVLLNGKDTCHTGQGTVFLVKIVKSEAMQLGKFALSDVPTQLLNTPNPARFKTHLLGNEYLKRFNVFFDFRKNVVYLKPNSLQNLEYVDAE